MADNDKAPEAAESGSAGDGGANAQLNAYAIDRLAQAFESSAKRWELIVYPSLFAFIILAAYGFYLVFSLAKDIHFLAVSVDSNMTVMTSNIQAISDNVGQMRANVRTMAASVQSISRDANSLTPMLTSMEAMDKAVQSITFTAANMRDDMAGMNHSIGRPMNFMNWFMPW